MKKVSWKILYKVNLIPNLLIFLIILLGELSMQKVKVHRYVSGKRPDYAQDQRSDSESEDDDFLDKRNHPHARLPSPEVEPSDDDMNDPRLRRLKIREADTEIRPERRRHVHEPEVLQTSDDEDDKEQIHLPGKSRGYVDDILLQAFSNLPVLDCI